MDRDAAPRTDRLTAEVERLKRQLRAERVAHRAQLAKLEENLRDASLESGAYEPKRVTPEPMPSPQPVMQAVARMEVVDSLERFDVLFAAQTVDLAWARTTEREIEQKLRRELPSVRLDAVSCHSTICRIETVHGDADAYRRFLDDAFGDPSKRLWMGDAVSKEPVSGASGELILVSFFVREGVTL